MGIPDYQSIMLPLLKFSNDGIEHTPKEAIENLSKFFNLTEEEITRLYPNQKNLIFYDRIQWALTFLKHAGLLISIKRGVFKITERGHNVLKQNPERIDDKYLRQFPEFIRFRGYVYKSKQKIKNQTV